MDGGMAHDGNSRREATQRLPDSGSGARAPEAGPGRGGKPAPSPVGLAKLDLGGAKPTKPTPVPDDPPRKFIPPAGVTRKVGPGSAPPDIPRPHAGADWGTPATSGKASAKIGAGGPPPDIPLPQAGANWGAPRADKPSGRAGGSSASADIPLPQLPPPDRAA